MLRKFVLVSSSIALGMGQAHAQQIESTNQDSSIGGEIIVTAQKRAQRITDVPMAISAYSGEFLEKFGGTELTMVSAITPGFVIQLQDKFAPGFAIRGITSDDVAPQSEQRVAVFQDGVPVPQASAAYGEIFDIERIEIEKGPQSTLHGRSALNGGISIFQKRPTDELSVELKGGAGNYDYRMLQGVVNLPLSDTLGIRFGALVRKRDGFVKDIQGGSFNALNARAYRFAGRWAPSQDFSVNLVATYDVDDTKGGVPFKSRTFLPLDQGTGQVVGDLNFWTPTHLDTFGTLPAPYFHRKILGVSGTTEWKLDDRFSLTSITGYRWYDACQSADSDGTTTNLIAYKSCNDGKQVSEELRLNFRGLGILEGFIGASYFNAKNGGDVTFGYDERAMALLLGGTLAQFAPRGLTNNEIVALLGPAASNLKAFHLDRQITRAKIGTWDVFGDVTAHLTDRLDLFAGGRITEDKKDVTFQGLLPIGPSSLTGGGLMLQPTPGQRVLSGSNSSRILTGRAGLRYKVTPNVNLYAVYGIGKRPEVLQLNPNGSAQTIPAEALKSAEAGVKVRLLGGRLVGDASVYHYRYDNFETRESRGGVIATVNAGKANATGFEAQASYDLTRGVSIFGSYGYNHGRFRSGLYEGNFFRNSPDHKFAFGANFEAAVSGGTMSFAPLYTWQSKMFFSDDNDRLDLQQRRPAGFSDRVVDEFQTSYGLLSARLGFKANHDRWSFALIGDNLTDKKFVVDAGNFGDFFGMPTFVAGTRRTYRAEFGFKF